MRLFIPSVFTEKYLYQNEFQFLDYPFIFMHVQQIFYQL